MKMALPRRLFLQPTRVGLSIMTSPSSIFGARILLCEKLQPLKTWIKGFEPALRNHARNPHWEFFMHRCYANNIYKSGMKFGMGSVFGVSIVFGSISLGPRTAYANNGSDILGNDDHATLPRTTNAEEGLLLARKLLPPVFLFLTVLMNWGHPTILVAKVILILFGTKPRPFSVYLFIEQLRQQLVHQHPFLYKFKSLHAKKVEVEDYKIFCLARIELNDQEFTLIGILGSWWVLPWSTSQEASSLSMRKFLQNYVRKRDYMV